MGAPDYTELRARIMSAPDPLSTAPRWSTEAMSDDIYSLGGDTIAKAMLLLLAERPELVGGKDAHDFYDLVERRWPGFDRWLGGASGFMVGWAANVASQLLQGPSVPNPALWTITTDGGTP